MCAEKTKTQKSESEGGPIRYTIATEKQSRRLNITANEKIQKIRGGIVLEFTRRFVGGL